MTRLFEILRPLRGLRMTAREQPLRHSEERFSATKNHTPTGFFGASRLRMTTREQCLRMTVACILLLLPLAKSFAADAGVEFGVADDLVVNGTGGDKNGRGFLRSKVTPLWQRPCGPISYHRRRKRLYPE